MRLDGSLTLRGLIPRDETIRMTGDLYISPGSRLDVDSATVIVYGSLYSAGSSIIENNLQEALRF